MSVPLPPGWVATGETKEGGESFVTFVKNVDTGQNAVFKIPKEGIDEQDLMKQWVIANQVREAYPDYKGLEKRVQQLTRRGTLLTVKAPGQPLADLLESGHNLTPIWANIVIAVDHLHKLGWAHNDLQQGNIIVDIGNRAVTIIDFGKAAPNVVEHQYNWDSIMLETYYGVSKDGVAIDAFNDIPGLWADFFSLVSWHKVFNKAAPGPLEKSFERAIMVNPQLSEIAAGSVSNKRAFQMWLWTSLTSMEFIRNEPSVSSFALEFISSNVRGHRLALTNVPQFPSEAAMVYEYAEEKPVGGDIPEVVPEVVPELPKSIPRLSTPKFTPAGKVTSVEQALQLMGLPANYTKKELTSAYRKKYTEFHPDKMRNKLMTRGASTFTPKQLEKIDDALSKKYLLPLQQSKTILEEELERRKHPQTATSAAAASYAASWKPPERFPDFSAHNVVRWSQASSLNDLQRFRLAKSILRLPLDRAPTWDEVETHYDRLYENYTHYRLEHFRPPPGAVPPSGYMEAYQKLMLQARNARMDLDYAFNFIGKLVRERASGRHRTPLTPDVAPTHKKPLTPTKGLTKKQVAEPDIPPSHKKALTPTKGLSKKNVAKPPKKNIKIPTPSKFRAGRQKEHRGHVAHQREKKVAEARKPSTPPPPAPPPPKAAPGKYSPMYRASREARILGRGLERRKRLVTERRRNLASSPEAAPARTPRRSERTPAVTMRLVDLWRRAYAGSRSAKDKKYYKTLLAKHGYSVK